MASRKKLPARPATQVQSGGGIVDTGKPTGIRSDDENQRDRWSTYVLSTGLI
jgi:hypothetical protein